ncbi:MAG: hypothetical protein MUP97_14670, partial [Acidimicrobiia bacterium]|nr:hypothetical protein [Acidimicrobiia bacterium]
LKGIIHHPQLELVAVKVYDDAKVGRDAGDLVGLPTTGILATQDVDEIVAVEADCVIYCPMPWDVEEMCRLLASGKHIVTPCSYWFPFIQDPAVTAQLGEARRAAPAASTSTPPARTPVGSPSGSRSPSPAGATGSTASP